jgi:hypothetical protein
MKILFGSIVTAGAGRLNGHQVRNFRGMALITKLALPTQTFNLRQNAQKAVASYAFKLWSSLTEAQQIGWESNAEKIEFIDRWGRAKYLNGKDFVSFIGLNCAKANITFPSYTTFQTIKPTITATGLVVGNTPKSIVFSDFAETDGSKQMIFANWTNNRNINFNDKKLKFYTAFVINDFDPEEIHNLLNDAGIEINTGSYLTLGIKNISSSGLVSPMLILKGLVS